MKKTILLLVAMLATTTMWATDFITDVMVIGGSKSETTNLKNKYTGQGWTFIDQDLNAGCGSGSDYIYLLYKSASNENQDAGAFITDFYISTVSGTASDNIYYKGRTYHLVSFDGSDYFKNSKGDLNSHCGSSSAYIHLYYAKDSEENYRSTAVSSIEFNSTSTNAVCADTTTTVCDLNKGAGGDYIYMHANSALKGWIPYMNYAGTECYINGYAGVKNNKTEVTIPLTIDGATVLYFSGPVFSGFANLESMNFYKTTVIDGMPSVQGCSKFKHVNTGSTIDKTPPSMTRIPSTAFVGTAISTITLDSVTYVGSDAFKGCDSLTSVTFRKSPVLIEDGAFSEISTACQVSYPGSMEDWNPVMYMYSPNLIVKGRNASWCGWCGGANAASNNHLYWTLQNYHLKINCATDIWDSHPEQQEITTHNWITGQYLTLDHVYRINPNEFSGVYLDSVDVKSGLKEIFYWAFKNCKSLKKIFLPSSVTKIGVEAFIGCDRMKDLYFDGTHSEWVDSILREDGWNAGVAESFQAHWHCTVTFDANGHGTAPAAQYIEWSNEDTADEPAAPTATGYNFKGWYKEPECINKWDFTWTVPGDMTLYAKWEANLQRGDINGDGKVDVSDVNIIINIMLGKAQASSYPGNPDLNNDNKVDVTDVNAVINIMLGKE